MNQPNPTLKEILMDMTVLYQGITLQIADIEVRIKNLTPNADFAEDAKHEGFLDTDVSRLEKKVRLFESA